MRPSDHFLLSQPEIIERNGYPVEIHDVTTEDGYILNLFRIPHGKTKERGQEGPPVYLQHGFGSSSACFVNIGPKSLGKWRRGPRDVK